MKTFFNNGSAQRLNPLNDFLFFKVMGEKGDEVQLLGFLNAVLGRSGKELIRSLEIMENTSFKKDFEEGKSCILDVLAVLQDGTRANIEVQLSNEHNMDRRSLFYWSRVYTESLKEGQNYRELPDVIAINILDFDFPRGGSFHTRFRLREDADPALTLSALEIHFVNMVQWRRLEGKDLQNDPLHRWLAWFDGNSPPELLEEVIKMDSAIMAAHEKQDYVTQDENVRQSYWRRQMAIMDRNGQLEYAHDEGLAEGIEQGRAEAQANAYNEKLQIARKLKEMGLPITQIVEGTGLSLKAIEQL